MNPEVLEELLILLRNQQREIAELHQSQLELLQRVTGHMDAVQSSVIAHVEHVMVSQQEHERILTTGICYKLQLLDLPFFWYHREL